jgi:hypothetical protein
MQFDDFARAIDAAVRAAAPVERADGPRDAAASWDARELRASIALVPPQNVSVTLTRPRAVDDVTWYPIDAALVPVVSKRIARHLGAP